MLIVLMIYSLAVMLAAAAVLPDGGKIVELIFYAVAGIAWVLPAGYLIIDFALPDGGAGA